MTPLRPFGFVVIDSEGRRFIVPPPPSSVFSSISWFISLIRLECICSCRWICYCAIVDSFLDHMFCSLLSNRPLYLGSENRWHRYPATHQSHTYESMGNDHLLLLWIVLDSGPSSIFHLVHWTSSLELRLGFCTSYVNHSIPLIPNLFLTRASHKMKPKRKSRKAISSKTTL